MPEQNEPAALATLQRAAERLRNDDPELAARLLALRPLVRQTLDRDRDRQIIGAVLGIADVNRSWRYMNRASAQDGLVRRLGRARLPLIRAHLKGMLDYYASRLIQHFPVEEMPITGEATTLDDGDAAVRFGNGHNEGDDDDE